MCKVVLPSWEISEEVLFSALAQNRATVTQKERKKKQLLPACKWYNPHQPRLRLMHSMSLKSKSLLCLMLYGHREERFQESVLEFSEEENEVEEKTQEVTAKVFEKIFLDLQQDEIELAHPDFKALFYVLLEQFQTQGEVAIDQLMPTLAPELSNLVSTILMDEEKYALHQWEKKNIYVKGRDQQMGLMVTETILSLRKHLVNKKLESLNPRWRIPQANTKTYWKT